MARFNLTQAEQEARIQSIAGEGVSVDRASQTFRENLLGVKVEVKRYRLTTKFGNEGYGVDANKSEELNEFFKEYMENGKLSFIPNTDEKRLHNIEAKVRVTRDRMAFGYDNQFMTLDTYKEFKAYVDKARIEYEEVRDSICDRWSDLMARFKEILRASLNDMNALNREQIYERVINRIPSREEYRNSFAMRISVTAFPVAENLIIKDEAIASEIKESHIEDTIRNVEGVIANTLADCFTTTNNLLVSYDKNSKIAVKTMQGLKDGAGRIRKKNLFKNATVDSIAKDMEIMSSMTDADSIAERAEIVLAKIYGYAKELDLLEHLPLSKSAIGEEELFIIYKSYKSQEETEA